MTAHVSACRWAAWCDRCMWVYDDCIDEGDAIYRAERHEDECKDGAA